MVDDRFLLLANSGDQGVTWRLPRMWAPQWQVVLRTDTPDGLPARSTRRTATVEVPERCLILLEEAPLT